MSTLPRSDHRRSTRLGFRCRVKITGVDARGNPFMEQTETINISKNGASLWSGHDYPMGQVITVQTLDRGHTGQFQIVWRGQPGTRQAGQIGIEWFDARRFWGVEFPPDDWGAR